MAVGWAATRAGTRRSLRSPIPDNQLFPGLYLPDGLTLKPTDSYTQFLTDLRAARITRQRARQLAADNRDRILHTIDDQNHHDLHDTLKRLTPATEEHANAQLEDIRITLAPLFGVRPTPTSSMRELFWLVPVALGLALTDAGDFAAALDWYQYAYAYQLPAGQSADLPRPGAEHDDRSPPSTVRPPGRPTGPTRTRWPGTGPTPTPASPCMSIARCLLAYADNEFIRATAASNARARALYEAALDLLRSADAAPPSGANVPFPAEPGPRAALETHAHDRLDKIHRGLNIASTLPEPTDRESVQPSQYRYAVLVERAKNLIAIAAAARGGLPGRRRAGRRRHLHAAAGRARPRLSRRR